MKKIGKVLAWIVLFPFMLTYWGWKKKNKLVMIVGSILSVFFILVAAFSDSPDNEQTGVPDNNVEPTEISEPAEENKPDQGDSSDQEAVEAAPEESAVESEPAEEKEEAQEDTPVVVEEASTEDASQETAEEENQPVVEVETVEEPTVPDMFEGCQLIEVDGGDLSGHREANVVVDIGFGDREYYAFTNEYGQLVKVTAKEIILQDDSTEPVLDSGRYYPDEAKVPGTESPTLDEGHVIADSLGGVSSAYNITPQESTLNRHGDQAYMEKGIRDAGGCTDFTAIITYPDTSTQIPSHYTFTYTLMGNIIVDDFDNVDPDEVNAEIEETTPAVEKTAPVEEQSGQVEITKLDKKAEYIILKNTGSSPVDMTGWVILSVRGEQSFTFSNFTLESGATVKIGDSAKNQVDFHWLDGRGTWNNSDSDPAELYNVAGELVDRWDD